MKKNKNSGFVLAETLVVTVFLMTIFTMIYYYFYPLIGEYEKREVYDDVDGKYSLYWVKRIIEDSGYTVEPSSPKGQNFKNYGYFRFECKDVPVADEKQQMCKTFVNALQIEGCTNLGNGCNIFVTAYRIGNNPASAGVVNFKDTVKRNNLKRYREDCAKNKSDSACRAEFVSRCLADKYFDDKECNTNECKEQKCGNLADTKIFYGGFQDYVELLPDYKVASTNKAKYRLIVSFQHTMDNNNYHSYATMEVG